MKSTVERTSAPVPTPVAVTPPPRSPRSWLRRIFGGGQIVETCPAWCVQDHFDDTAGHLDDLFHGSEQVAMDLRLNIEGFAKSTEWPALAAHVEVHPYSDRPEWGEPHVVVAVAPDDVLDSLTLEQFAKFIADGRAHFDRLESEVLGLAQQVRAEYEQQRNVVA